MIKLPYPARKSALTEAIEEVQRGQRARLSTNRTPNGLWMLPARVAPGPAATG